MSRLDDYKAILTERLPGLVDRYRVRSLGLFGSYVRHQERPDSDLDILVSFSATPGLLRFAELEIELSDLLGVKVDLVMADALKPRIGERIRRELIEI